MADYDRGGISHPDYLYVVTYIIFCLDLNSVVCSYDLQLFDLAET